ncbi:MAG: response regulator, partial [Candidatus Eremiobacterota bacterium]
MGQPRILILEDDEALRTLLSAILEEQGYAVVAVDRALDAIQQARQAPFDLVVADIRMEGMSGLDALQVMKEHQPEVGSIVVTGYS